MWNFFFVASDLERGTPDGKFVQPGPQHAERHNHEMHPARQLPLLAKQSKERKRMSMRACINPFCLKKMLKEEKNLEVGEEGNGLQRLAQSHLVGQNAAANAVAV